MSHNIIRDGDRLQIRASITTLEELEQLIEKLQTCDWPAKPIVEPTMAENRSVDRTTTLKPSKG